MKIINVHPFTRLPNDFTGIAKLKNGTTEYYLNGLLHRLDGPAIEYSNGAKEWYLNGKRHRVDGPAIELSNGLKKWCINGIYLEEKEFYIITGLTRRVKRKQ